MSVTWIDGSNVYRCGAGPQCFTTEEISMKIGFHASWASGLSPRLALGELRRRLILSRTRIAVPRTSANSLIAALLWLTAQAAELDGVQLPDTLQVDGKTLHLNGFGLRTYSILGIHIYVADL